MRITRRQLAKAYVQLSDTFSEGELAQAVASLLLRLKRGREAHFLAQDIAGEFSQAKGVAVAQIKSARALTSAAKKLLVGFLKEQSGLATTSIVWAVDSDMLGGARVETPTHIYDMSVHAKLDQLVKQSR